MPFVLLSRLEFSAMAASRVANMPHSERDTALSKAASGALTLSVIWYILVTPNPKPVFVWLIAIAVRRPLRRSRLRVTEWIGSLNKRCNGCASHAIFCGTAAARLLPDRIKFRIADSYSPLGQCRL